MAGCDSTQRTSLNSLPYQKDWACSSDGPPSSLLQWFPDNSIDGVEVNEICDISPVSPTTIAYPMYEHRPDLQTVSFDIVDGSRCFTQPQMGCMEWDSRAINHDDVQRPMFGQTSTFQMHEAEYRSPLSIKTEGFEGSVASDLGSVPSHGHTSDAYNEIVGTSGLLMKSLSFLKNQQQYYSSHRSGGNSSRKRSSSPDLLERRQEFSHIKYNKSFEGLQQKKTHWSPECSSQPITIVRRVSLSPPPPILSIESRKRRKPSITDIDDDNLDDDVEDRNDPDSPPSRRASSTTQLGFPIKKTAHNMIEKRYRTNLNDKIAALRNSVPSLRAMSSNKVKGSGAGLCEDDEEEKEDLQGLTPAHKLNKATILSKATEYIAHLEKRNKSLTVEVRMLSARLETLESS